MTGRDNAEAERVATPGQDSGDGMAPVKGFVFDIDGTLAMANRGGQGYTPLPGAAAVVARLDALGLPAVAYTNGTFHTPEKCRADLAAVGIAFAPGHVMTPASVAAAFFVREGITRVLVLGVEGAKQPLREAGIAVVEPGADGEAVAAVLIGWFPGFTFPDLDAACRAVWAGAALYTVSDAPFFASRDGRMLGISGAIGAMIASVTGKRATVLGKPAVQGLRIACARMGLRAADVAVVGDDPTLEVAMARRGGARAVGVLTSASRQ